ncbi:MAG: hypothetical protein K2K56_03145 [Lachnospiraceae bacterium]|nr:hypothetical protein [Lachnospiraceae bacterium]
MILQHEVACLTCACFQCLNVCKDSCLNCSRSGAVGESIVVSAEIEDCYKQDCERKAYADK